MFGVWYVCFFSGFGLLYWVVDFGGGWIFGVVGVCGNGWLVFGFGGVLLIGWSWYGCLLSVGMCFWFWFRVWDCLVVIWLLMWVWKLDVWIGCVYG